MLYLFFNKNCAFIYIYIYIFIGLIEFKLNYHLLKLLMRIVIGLYRMMIKLFNTKILFYYLTISNS